MVNQIGLLLLVNGFMVSSCIREHPTRFLVAKEVCSGRGIAFAIALLGRRMTAVSTYSAVLSAESGKTLGDWLCCWMSRALSLV